MTNSSDESCLWHEKTCFRPGFIGGAVLISQREEFSVLFLQLLLICQGRVPEQPRRHPALGLLLARCPILRERTFRMREWPLWMKIPV
jgi:hypothetical protein